MIRRALAAAVAALTLTGCPWFKAPTVGISRPVVHGGTNASVCLDRGNVCSFNAYTGGGGPTCPNQGFVHLAGHANEAGGVFGNLTGLRLGDAVYLCGIRHIVYSHDVRHRNNWGGPRGAAMLQTSAGEWWVHLFYLGRG